jgi:hypothetical protein
MTSYLVETVLFVALVITTWRVTTMHRELKRLRLSEAEFVQTTTKMNRAFDDVAATVHDLSANGTTLVHLLGRKIDEARELMVEIDRRRSERKLRASDSDGRGEAERHPIPFATIGRSGN